MRKALKRVWKVLLPDGIRMVHIANSGSRICYSKLQPNPKKKEINNVYCKEKREKFKKC